MPLPRVLRNGKAIQASSPEPGFPVSRMGNKPSIHEIINDIVGAPGGDRSEDWPDDRLDGRLGDQLNDQSDDRSRDSVAVRKKAMDLLARREHTRTELERKLESAGFEADVVVAVVEVLGDEGLQSDTRFVESFVQSRINQGKGPARIRAELNEKGVAESVTDDAIGAVGVDWQALAAEVRQKKFGRAAPADFKDKSRQMRFLQYRGFESDQIHAAVGGED